LRQSGVPQKLPECKKRIEPPFGCSQDKPQSRKAGARRVSKSRAKKLQVRGRSDSARPKQASSQAAHALRKQNPTLKKRAWGTRKSDGTENEKPQNFAKTAKLCATKHETYSETHLATAARHGAPEIQMQIPLAR
jgi:hypothetical protein